MRESERATLARNDSPRMVSAITTEKKGCERVSVRTLSPPRAMKYGAMGIRPASSSLMTVS